MRLADETDLIEETFALGIRVVFGYLGLLSVTSMEFGDVQDMGQPSRWRVFCNVSSLTLLMFPTLQHSATTLG
jgi:hypothetical protein